MVVVVSPWKLHTHFTPCAGVEGVWALTPPSLLLFFILELTVRVTFPGSSRRHRTKTYAVISVHIKPDVLLPRNVTTRSDDTTGPALHQDVKYPRCLTSFQRCRKFLIHSA